MSYQLEMSRHDMPGMGFQTVYTGQAHEARIIRLLPSTTYVVRVCARSLAGLGPYSDVTFFTTPSFSPRADEPSNVHDQSTASWAMRSNTGSIFADSANLDDSPSRRTSYAAMPTPFALHAPVAEDPHVYGVVPSRFPPSPPLVFFFSHLYNLRGQVPASDPSQRSARCDPRSWPLLRRPLERPRRHDAPPRTCPRACDRLPPPPL
jgi:hypothetical protein